jgi:hypothetical protein
MPVEAKPLFRPDVLRPHLQAFVLPASLPDSKAILAKWATMLSTGRADKFKEQELLPDFLTGRTTGTHTFVAWHVRISNSNR